jgi:exonuclease SbcD
MRLVHFSDLHLGFRQYQRQTPTGINQREADVALAFRRAVDKTIEIAPDLVLVAGDVFHNVRPTNPAILHAFQQFGRLRASLPEAIVVVVAGNHDTPRSAETGCILRLFEQLGVHVVDLEARRLTFEEHDLSILAVPDMLTSRPALVPDPAARRNILVLHGEVTGVLPSHAAMPERATQEVTPEELTAGGWDYVALGHYHVFREVAPGAFYSGSLEYTSPNTWGELVEERSAKLPGKGIVEFDLATRRRVFHHVPPARAQLDLAVISARGMSAADLDAAIRANLEKVPGGIDDKVVRQVVRDVPRHIVRELDHKALRDYKRRALHFHLDTRRPELLREREASGAPGRRPSLADIVRDKLHARILPGDVDRERLVALGLQYLRDAEMIETAVAPVEGA